MENKRDKISLKELIKILRKRIIIILVVITAFIVAATILVFVVIKPTYEANTSIIIGNSFKSQGSELQYNDLMLYQKLVKTYCSIAKTTIVAEKTIDKLNLNMTDEEFQQHIIVTPQDDTQILVLKVKWDNPKEAVSIINTLSEVFIQESKEIYPLGDVKIIDKVKIPDKPVSPKKKLIIGISFLIGIFISCILVMIMEYLDNTIKTEEDVEEYMGLNVIGAIPKEAELVDSFDSFSEEKFGRVTEAFRTFRTNLEFSSIDNKVKTIMITSGRAGEGKTTIAYILASLMAQSGKKTLLIDCDLRKPKVHSKFNLDNKTGVSDILARDIKWTEAIYRTNVENLYVLTAGLKPPNPTELLSSHKMKDFISLLKEELDYIILDTPPVGIVTDAQILSAYADGCVFVLASGEAVKEETVKAKRLLEYVNGKILGVCLNKIKEGKKGDYGYYLQEDKKTSKKTIKKGK